MKVDKILLFITLLIHISSCNFKENENIPVYNIEKKDFESSIVLSGIVEPILYTTLFCPMNVNGTITFLIDDGVYVEEGEVVCVIKDENNEDEYDNLQTFIEAVEAELTKKKAELDFQFALLQAQVDNNDIDTEISNLDSLQSRFSSPIQRRISELQLERAYIEKNRLDRKLESLEVINQSEIRTLEIQLQRLYARLQTAEDVLNSLTIKAPKAGLAIIAESRRSQAKLIPGDDVWENIPIIIIPEDSEMKVTMKVNETEFRYINLNDSVSFTFDAMPDNWGYGRITKKLPVGQPISRNSKVKFFEVEASLDSFLIKPESGFTANSKVITDHLRDTIVVPQISIFNSDSIQAVYVKKNRKYELRQIKTGKSSLKDAVVSEGLQIGEQISLIQPKSSLVSGRKLLSE